VKFIGCFSHARVARDRPLRRTGPESRIMYTGLVGASNAPSTRRAIIPR
jgi:hypothetical protein